MARETAGRFREALTEIIPEPHRWLRCPATTRSKKWGLVFREVESDGNPNAICCSIRNRHSFLVSHFPWTVKCSLVPCKT